MCSIHAAMAPGFRAIALILFLLGSILSRPLTSFPEDTYEVLRQQYLSLRNTDIEIVRRSEWESVADKLVGHSNAKNVPVAEASSALFQAAMLREAIGMRFSDREQLLQAVKLLTQLVTRFPEAENADDSYVRLGDIALYELKDIAKAKQQYSTVINAYPRSDMAEIARIRLRDLSSGPPAKSPKESREPEGGPLIVIDPGHGGEDTGAVGVGGLIEKDVALDIALRVESLLRAQKTSRVRLTRRNDRFVPLAERTNFSNDFDADLFLSIHTNASPKGKASGMETYYLDTTDDAASKKLAERENSSLRFEEGGIGDLQFMVSDLIQNAKLDESIVLAHSVHRSLLKSVKPYWKGVRDLGVKKGPFYVLVGAHMPCVLVELFFIDNKEDGRRLADKKFRDLLAQGIFNGVQQYLKREKGGGARVHEKR